MKLWRPRWAFELRRNVVVENKVQSLFTLSHRSSKANISRCRVVSEMSKACRETRDVTRPTVSRIDYHSLSDYLLPFRCCLQEPFLDNHLTVKFLPRYIQWPGRSGSSGMRQSFQWQTTEGPLNAAWDRSVGGH